MDFTPPFGAWLKQQRARLDLTQGDLARRVGYSPETIRKIEAGALRPSKQIVDLLGDHLGVPPAQRDAFLAFATDARTANANAKAEPAPTNLPTPATPLIGRETDVVAVRELLTTRSRTPQRSPTPMPPVSRLVTLAGPPGVGKTRLAFEVAREVKDSFPGGAWWVELAPITEPQTALTTIAQALEIEDRPGKPILRVLQDHLRDKQLLLALDNLEQVLDVAPLIGHVLSAAPKVKVLVTSREPLRISGEQVYNVEPLSVADEAVVLFAQRAQAVKPDFAPIEANRAIIADICRKLDGLPLAIELAAARVTLFTPGEMLARLDQRLSLLTGGARDLLARQRTLRATLDWSYDLLTPDEQALFRRLGVFAGGCTLHAAQTFCEIDALPLTAEDGLAALVAKNLIVRREDGDGASRYVMLETMREFALEKLKEHGEYDVWMENLGWYLLAMAEVVRRTEYKTLHSDADNWRTFMRWAQTRSEADDLELLLASYCDPYDPDVLSGQTVVVRSLSRPQMNIQPSRAQLEALSLLCATYRLLGELRAGVKTFDKIVRSWRDFDDVIGVQPAMFGRAHLAREQGDVETARTLLRKYLQWSRAVGDHVATFNAELTLSEVEVAAESPDEATHLLIAAEQSFQTANLHDPISVSWFKVWSANHKAHVAQLEGRHADARQLLQESLKAAEVSGSLIEWKHSKVASLGWNYQSLGESALAEGNTKDAADWYRKGLCLTDVFVDRVIVAWCLSGLTGACALDEEPERGARLWGASEALRERIGCRIAPASRLNRERTVALLRQQLGEAEFVRLAAEGARMTVDEAVAFALEDARESHM
jgi:predicted ATPase/transcriptional regulator with XRE-family HTH domain